METWNLKLTPRFTSVSLDDATLEPVEGGTLLSYRREGTGVRLMVTTASGLDPRALASSLIDVVGAKTAGN